MDILTQAPVIQVNADGPILKHFSPSKNIAAFTMLDDVATKAAQAEALRECVMTKLQSYPLTSSVIGDGDASGEAVRPGGVQTNKNKTGVWGAFSMLAIAAIVLPLLTTQAPAATLNVSGGQLLGASGVNVGGTLYDVQFLDGTCVALFSGCDNAAEDFTFPVFADATAAAQALLDQVFFDGPQGNFDTEPELTRGCESTVECQIAIPFTVGQVKFAINSNGVVDSDGVAFRDPTDDFTNRADHVYAVFAPAAAVPLPATLPLFGTGLALLGLFGWRRRRAAAA